MNYLADRATDGVAVAAVSSPFWLTFLSETSSLILPILGAAWLLMQMYFFLKKQTKKEDDK